MTNIWEKAISSLVGNLNLGLITTVTAENGSAGQPANQKGNEIKISFSDTMYVY